MFNPMAADWDKTMMQLVDNLTEWTNSNDLY